MHTVEYPIQYVNPRKVGILSIQRRAVGTSSSPSIIYKHANMPLQGLYPDIRDASVGKPSLLVRLTDQRFLTNTDATVST